MIRMGIYGLSQDFTQLFGFTFVNNRWRMIRIWFLHLFQFVFLLPLIPGRGREGERERGVAEDDKTLEQVCKPVYGWIYSYIFLHESSDSSINRKSKAEVLGYRAPCPPRVSDTRPYSSPFIGFFSLLKSYSGFFFYIQLDFIFLFFHESVMRLWNNVEFYFLLTITFVWRKKS